MILWVICALLAGITSGSGDNWEIFVAAALILIALDKSEPTPSGHQTVTNLLGKPVNTPLRGGSTPPSGTTGLFAIMMRIQRDHRTQWSVRQHLLPSLI